MEPFLGKSSKMPWIVIFSSGWSSLKMVLPTHCSTPPIFSAKERDTMRPKGFASISVGLPERMGRSKTLKKQVSARAKLSAAMTL